MDIQQTVVSTPKDYSFSELDRACTDGDIITDPKWQRDFVYTDAQSSKLIESAFLGIPIPTVYLCQEDDDSFTVIDGQQRIRSIVKFLNNDLRLTGLSAIPELNGFVYKELSKQQQRCIRGCTIHAVSILKQSQDIKYEIFARLNQGAVRLKPQELRNCIYRGSFNDLLEEDLQNNPHLPKLFHCENKRKNYQEYILRFFALRNYLDYKGSILKAMNNFMESHRNETPEYINNCKKLFNDTIDIIVQVLGEEAFFAVERGSGEIIRKFSGSVYDSIIIPFSYFKKHDLMHHADKIRKAIFDLKKSDLQYQDNTYAATGSRVRVIGRIQAVYNLITDITGSFGDDDNKRIFSEETKKLLFKPGYICSYCGNEILSIDDAEVDHILPFNEGGKTEIANAQLLHRHCNREKSDKLYDEENDDDAIHELEV